MNPEKKIHKLFAQKRVVEAGKMSPLSNANNNNNNNTNSSSSLTSGSSANNTSNSAFKPLVSENRQLNMLSSTVTSASAASVDPYTSDLSAYGSAYHHHHLNSQLSTQDYLNVHHQTLPLSVYKTDHDDLQSGYSFARPVVSISEDLSRFQKSSHHSTNGCGGTGGMTLLSIKNTNDSIYDRLAPNDSLITGSTTTNGSSVSAGYTASNLNGYRGDAPSPGASIIDLSTSSVTSLRSGVGATGFTSSSYYDGQRYDRSPQSASSPHYSSPQMLSPQGQTLDLSVGRTT